MARCLLTTQCLVLGVNLEICGQIAAAALCLFLCGWSTRRDRTPQKRVAHTVGTAGSVPPWALRVPKIFPWLCFCSFMYNTWTYVS